ncbi:transglutaminase-like domain-containing protein [Glaciihabitans sp. dw_435]|uniref:transglutaminase-like domain-containing protein n=1 Tax=Glaciihabitans sp. dw_435 TaxID=2720081 RepID=UPI001BD52939|nr:transglutaminase-like domain-containing protein [Glaciihabitans sp. dw_435]
MRAARPSASFIVLNTLALWLAVGVAACALWPIYRTPQVVVVVAVTVVVASLIAILGAVFRWSAPIVAGATLLAYFAFGVPLAVPSQATSGIVPTLTGLRELILGAAFGWKQLLTISLPVGSYESLLVPFYLLILVVTVVAASVALRSRHGDLAVLGPIALYVIALVFGGETPFLPVVLPLALLSVTLLWISWRRWYRRHVSIRSLTTKQDSERTSADSRFTGVRAGIAATVLLAIAAGAAVVVVAALPPASAREVLRAATVQPFDPRDSTSPLAAFRTYWQEPTVDDVLLTVRGLPKGARLKLATLDSYNGVVYSVGSSVVDSASGSFTRLPFELDQSAVRGTPATLTVDVGDYAGMWVPSAGALERFAVTGGADATELRNSFYYNTTTGSAVVLDGLAAGDSYSIDTVLPDQPTVAQYPTLQAGTAQVPPLGAVPAELNSVLASYVAGVKGQGNQLVAMLAGLARDGYVSHGVGADAVPSRSGHSIDRISELLTDQRMIGDAEQFSVTAALMARQLGFPARVVMGFVPESSADVQQVRGRDVSAWVEVDTREYGWVAIDPNPAVRDIPAEQPQDPTRISRPQSVVPPVVSDPAPVDRQTTPDSEQNDPATTDPVLAIILAVARVVGWVAVGVAVLMAPFLVVIAAKVRRRRRRRRATSTLDRIRGGWSEFEDSVLDHGFDPPATATRSEVAAVVGGTQPFVLAAVADRAVFSPSEPDVAEADLVWTSVRELTASLNSGKTRWQRLRARISLRSMGRRI